MDDLDLRDALAHHATALDDRAPEIGLAEIEDRAVTRVRRAHSRRRPTVAVVFALALVLAIVVSVALVHGDDRNTSPAGHSVSGPTARRLEQYRWSRLPSTTDGARYRTSTVWTGREVIVWGGQTIGPQSAAFNTGAAFDPRAGTWRQLPSAPLAPRQNAAAVWTGREMIVWGGQDIFGSTPLTDGAAYDPARDTWRMLSPSPLTPRFGAEAIWTGHAVLVIGGNVPGTVIAAPHAASYDPTTDRWRLLPAMPTRTGHPVAFTKAVWIGTRLLVWQYWEVPDGRGPSAVGIDTVSYDPSTRRWRTIPRANSMPMTLYQPVWTGREVIVPPSSNFAAGGPGYVGSQGGFRYDPRTNRWRALPAGPLDNAPGPGVWTGRALVMLDTTTTIVNGPGEQGLLQGDGAAFDPRTNHWYALARPPAQLSDGEVRLVWTGHELIVAGPLAPLGSPGPAPGEDAGGLRLGP